MIGAEHAAEQNMPAELRLAYELTALNDGRDARLEIQKNINRKNQPYADALLADLYNSTGDMLLMMPWGMNCCQHKFLEDGPNLGSAVWFPLPRTRGRGLG